MYTADLTKDIKFKLVFVTETYDLDYHIEKSGHDLCDVKRVKVQNPNFFSKEIEANLLTTIDGLTILDILNQNVEFRYKISENHESVKFKLISKEFNEEEKVMTLNFRGVGNFPIMNHNIKKHLELRKILPLYRENQDTSLKEKRYNDLPWWRKKIMKKPEFNYHKLPAPHYNY